MNVCGGYVEEFWAGHRLNYKNKALMIIAQMLWRTLVGTVEVRDEVCMRNTLREGRHGVLRGECIWMSIIVSY